jgi:CRP-like cAMP-binding protein
LIVHTLDEVIASSPVFAGMAHDDLALIAGCAQNVGFEEGQLLFREGQPADTFYLVRKGRVALEVHTPERGGLVVDSADPGEVVGWSWLFPPYRWHFDARAAEEVRAIAFDGECLRGKCDEDPRLGYELMQRIAQVMIDRLQNTQLRLLDVYGVFAD